MALCGSLIKNSRCWGSAFKEELQKEELLKLLLKHKREQLSRVKKKKKRASGYIDEMDKIR